MPDAACQPIRWLMPGCCCAEMSKAPVSLGPEMSPCQCRWYRCKDIQIENQAGYRSRSVHSAQIPVRRHGQLKLVGNRAIDLKLRMRLKPLPDGRLRIVPRAPRTIGKQGLR